MKKQLILTLAVLSAAVSALASSAINVKITDRKGKVEETLTPLVVQPDGAKRLVIPKEYINIHTKFKGVRILNVEIESPDWRAQKGEDGYYIMPPMQMLKFDKDNGKIKGFWMMTAFGVKTPRACELVFVRNNPYDCELLAEVKDGAYRIYINIPTHRNGAKPEKDLVIDVYELGGSRDNYVGMAKKYREIQMHDYGVQPLRERAKNRPVLKKSVESMLLRIKHGAKPIMERDFTPENEIPPGVMNSFDDLKNYIVYLQQNGVKELDIHSVGWNIGGHDGRWPQMLPVDPRFGGELKFREAIKAAKDAGYQFSVHTNYTDAFRIAQNWDDNLIKTDLKGKIKGHGAWSGGKAYGMCPKQIVKLRLKEDMDIIQSLGVNGMHHIDVFSCMPPNICQSPNHYCSREDAVRAYATIKEECIKRFGGFTSESGYDWDMKNLDYALYISAYPAARPVGNDLISEMVPFWQIAYHGIVLSQPYDSTTDPFFKRKTHYLNDPDARLLKLIEYGGRPSFYWGNFKRDGMAAVKKMYDLYQPLKHLQWEFIEGHRELSKGVFLTTYSDGSQTICNYTDKEFPFRGETIQPKSFKLFPPIL